MNKVFVEENKLPRSPEYEKSSNFYETNQSSRVFRNRWRRGSSPPFNLDRLFKGRRLRHQELVHFDRFTRLREDQHVRLFVVERQAVQVGLENKLSC